MKTTKTYSKKSRIHTSLKTPFDEIVQQASNSQDGEDQDALEDKVSFEKSMKLRSSSWSTRAVSKPEMPYKTRGKSGAAGQLSKTAKKQEADSQVHGGRKEGNTGESKQPCPVSGTSKKTLQASGHVEEDKVVQWLQKCDQQRELFDEDTPSIERVRKKPHHEDCLDDFSLSLEFLSVESESGDRHHHCKESEIKKVNRNEMPSQVLSDGWYTESDSNTNDSHSSDTHIYSLANPSNAAATGGFTAARLRTHASKAINENLRTGVAEEKAASHGLESGGPRVLHSTPRTQMPAGLGMWDVSALTPISYADGKPTIALPKESLHIEDREHVPLRSLRTTQSVATAAILPRTQGKRRKSHSFKNTTQEKMELKKTQNLHITRKQEKRKRDKVLQDRLMPGTSRGAVSASSHKDSKVLHWLKKSHQQNQSGDEEMPCIELIREEQHNAEPLSGWPDGRFQGEKDSAAFFVDSSASAWTTVTDTATGAGPAGLSVPQSVEGLSQEDLKERKPACLGLEAYGPHVLHSTPITRRPAVLGTLDISSLTPISYADGKPALVISAESTPIRDTQIVLPRNAPKQKRSRRVQGGQRQRPGCSTMLFQSQMVEVVETFPEVSSIRSAHSERRGFGDVITTPFDRSDSPAPHASIARLESSGGKWSCHRPVAQRAPDQKGMVLTSTPTKNPPQTGQLPMDISSISSLKDSEEEELVPLRTSDAIVNSMEIVCDSLSEDEVGVPVIQETEDIGRARKVKHSVEVEGDKLPKSKSPNVPECILHRIPTTAPVPVQVYQCTLPGVDLSSVPVDTLHFLARMDLP